MTEPTKEERSEAAKKAAATRAENEAKESVGNLRKAADHALQAMKHLGLAGVDAGQKATKAVRKRAETKG